MKKSRIITILLCLVMLFSIVACGSKNGTDTSVNTGGNTGGQTSNEGTGSGSNTGGQTNNEGSSPSGNTGGSTNSGVAERSKTVNLGMEGKLTKLNPNDSTDSDTMMCLDMVFEGLLYGDHNDNYFPQLATEWTVADDGMSYTFKLREGVKFHNGEDFNADTVVFNIDYIIENRLLISAGSGFPELDSIEKLGEYEVIINMNTPRWDAHSNFSTIRMIPKGAYEEYGDNFFYDQIMYGTGPWIFEEWVDGQFCRYSKNKEYWDIANHDSYFEEAYIRFVTEASSAIAAHLSGGIEAYVGGGIGDDDLLKYVGSEQKTEIIHFDVARFTEFTMNFNGDSVFRDIKVRQALDMAIDRQALIDAFFPEAKIPSHGVFNPSVKGADSSIPDAVYDPVAAKKLLDESSYDGRQIKFLCRQGDWQEEVCLVVAEMWQQIGFNVVMDYYDFSVFMAMITEANYEIRNLTTGHGNGSPRGFINQLGNTTVKSYNGFNTLDGAEEVMPLVQQYLRAADDATRIELAQQINRLCSAMVAPRIVLVYHNLAHAVDYGISGILFYPDGQFRFQYVDWQPGHSYQG